MFHELTVIIQTSSPLHISVQWCLSFLKQYRTIAEEATPHIYLSALPFSAPPVPQLGEDPFHRLVAVSASVKPEAAGLVFYGHESVTTSAAFSPDKKLLVSASYDRTVRLWDVQSGTQIGQPFQGHKAWVTSVAFSYNGQLVCSGSNDHTIRLWDVETGGMVGQHMQDPSQVKAVMFSLDDQCIVSGSSDGGIRVWDVHTRTESGQPMLGHSDIVNTVAFSPDGWNIVSASDDGTAILWDFSTRNQIGRYAISIAADIAISSATFSQDGRYIVTGSTDRNVYLWDISSGTKSGLPFAGSSSFIVAVAISPDCRRVYSASDGGRICVWDLETRAPIGQWMRYESGIVSFAMSSDGQCAVCTFFDGTVRIHDLVRSDNQDDDLLTEAVANVPHRGFTFATFSPDGKRVVSGSEHGELMLWDVETGSFSGDTLTGHSERITSVSFSLDGHRAVSTSYDCTICVWDAKTREQLSRLVVHEQGATSASFSLDNALLVSSSMDGTARIWDSQTYTPVGDALILKHDEVMTASFSPDGKHILCGCASGTLLLWDVETRVGQPLEGVTAWLSSAPWSPDSQSIVGRSGGYKLYIWKLGDDGPISEQMFDHSGSTNRFDFPSFSPDGKLIVASSHDFLVARGIVSLWDVETRREVASFPGHPQQLNSVFFSHDGSLIVSASDHDTIRLWRPDISIDTETLNNVSVCSFVSL